MKQVLLALIIAAALPLDADAQTQATSRFDKNYKVCIKGDKYAVCDEDAKMNEKVGRDVKVTSDDKVLRVFDTYVHLGYSTKKNPRIYVQYDDPNGAYEGKETLINDGVDKNKARNINYLDASVQLPPVDGGNNSNK